MLNLSYLDGRSFLVGAFESFGPAVLVLTWERPFLLHLRATSQSSLQNIIMLQVVHHILSPVFMWVHSLSLVMMGIAPR